MASQRRASRTLGGPSHYSLPAHSFVQESSQECADEDFNCKRSARLRLLRAQCPILSPGATCVYAQSRDCKLNRQNGPQSLSSAFARGFHKNFALHKCRGKTVSGAVCPVQSARTFSRCGAAFFEGSQSTAAPNYGTTHEQKSKHKHRNCVHTFERAVSPDPIFLFEGKSHLHRVPLRAQPCLRAARISRVGRILQHGQKLHEQSEADLVG